MIWLESLQLIDALRYTQKSTLAFVGAGGKTTALCKVAREILNRGESGETTKTVLVTTTTHFGKWQAKLADHLRWIYSISDISKLEQDLPEGVVLLVGEETDQHLGGMAFEMLEKVHQLALSYRLPLLIEADGAHKLPLKAPANHEPVIPPFTQQIVVVAGLSGLGKPLTKKWVHRPEIFALLSGLNLGEAVSVEGICRILINRDGGLKNIPYGAHKVALLNQANNAELQSQAQSISKQLIHDFQSVIVASLRHDNNKIIQPEGKASWQQGEIHAVIERIGGIILAAGGSSRFGRPKQLLPWKEEPLIRHVIVAAVDAGLSPLLAVLGASADEIGPAISDLPVRIVNNPDWKTGVSSSIRAGVSALPREVGGAVFLQADQPQVSHLLIDSLVDMHQVTLGPIIAPLINGQRGNPVLFDVRTFPDLLDLREDMGGRALFSRFPVRWVIWHDPRQLMDIDSPEDYQKFLDVFLDNEVER